VPPLVGASRSVIIDDAQAFVHRTVAVGDHSLNGAATAPARRAQRLHRTYALLDCIELPPQEPQLLAHVASEALRVQLAAIFAPITVQGDRRR
jgi:hypothetical protein